MDKPAWMNTEITQTIHSLDSGLGVSLSTENYGLMVEHGVIQLRPVVQIDRFGVVNTTQMASLTEVGLELARSIIDDYLGDDDDDLDDVDEDDDGDDEDAIDAISHDAEHQLKKLGIDDDEEIDDDDLEVDFLDVDTSKRSSWDDDE